MRIAKNTVVSFHYTLNDSEGRLLDTSAGRDAFAYIHGSGMIVQRGLKAPPSFHIERLQKSPPGHFFDVTTNGLGAMQDYAAQITPEDRWRIAAYIRALQLSQNATLADVPPAERQKLEAARPPAKGASERKP